MINNLWILSTSVAEIEERVSFYSNVKLVCMLLCALFLILSVVLVFVFKIPKIISVKLGLEAKRTMKEFANGEATPSKVLKVKMQNSAEKMWNTQAPLSMKDKKTANLKFNERLDENATTVLEDNMATTVLEQSMETVVLDTANETTVLQSEQETTLLSECTERQTTLLESGIGQETTLLMPETTVLGDNISNQDEMIWQGGRKFILVRNIIMIHTQEIV